MNETASRQAAAAAVINKIQGSIRPVRLKFDGTPITARLTLHDSIEISASTAVPGTMGLVEALQGMGVDMKVQPAKGVAVAVLPFETTEALASEQRLMEA